jgi:hypothetical protein
VAEPNSNEVGGVDEGQVVAMIVLAVPPPTSA